MNTSRTYSVKEYAAILLGPGADGTADTVEPSKIRWLEKRLRGAAEPVLPGYKPGKKWRATQEDVDAAIELLRPQRDNPMPPIPDVYSMTCTSRRGSECNSAPPRAYPMNTLPRLRLWLCA